MKELLQINREKRKNADIGIFDISEEKDGWKKARDFLSQPSMFSETKTALIYESGSADIKEWRDLLKKEIDSSAHVVIISDETAPKKNFLFLLDPSVKSAEYKELEGRALEIFFKKEADARNISFSKELWNDFLQHIATTNLRSASGIHELDKCALFFKGKQITDKEAFYSIIQTTQEEDVFGVAKKIMFERDVKKRLALLEEAFLRGVDAAHLFNTISFLAREKDIETLANLDVKIKSGLSEYEEAITSFVLKK